MEAKEKLEEAGRGEVGKSRLSRGRGFFSSGNKRALALAAWERGTSCKGSVKGMRIATGPSNTMTAACAFLLFGGAAEYSSSYS